MSLLEKIDSALTAAGIRHALIGAAALTAYGINRASVDLDLFAASGQAKRLPRSGKESAYRANALSTQMIGRRPGPQRRVEPGAVLLTAADGPLSARNGFSSGHEGPLTMDDGSPSRDDENGTRSPVFRLRTTVRRLRTMNRSMRTTVRRLETKEMGRARRFFVCGRRFVGCA